MIHSTDSKLENKSLNIYPPTVDINLPLYLVTALYFSVLSVVCKVYLTDVKILDFTVFQYKHSYSARSTFFTPETEMHELLPSICPLPNLHTFHIQTIQKCVKQVCILIVIIIILIILHSHTTFLFLPIVVKHGAMLISSNYYFQTQFTSAGKYMNILIKQNTI